MWWRFSQCPISCVAVLPRLKGAVAVPFVPKAVLRITTPSVLAGPPGNCAYPKSPPANEQTQRFRYFLVGHEPAPPSVADFTESSSEKDVLVVLVRVIPLVGLPLGSFLARTNLILASVTKPDHTPGVLFRSGFFAL